MNEIKRIFRPERGFGFVEMLDGYIFTPEANAHKFIITQMVKANGEETEQAFAAGSIVSCRFLKSDKVTELLEGTLEDGAACVTLKPECYSVPGRFLITILVTSGSSVTCVYAASGTVIGADSENVNISEGASREIDEKIAEINAAAATAQAAVSQVQAAVAGVPAVIASIPQDYTTLSNSVGDLKSAYLNTSTEIGYVDIVNTSFTDTYRDITVEKKFGYINITGIASGNVTFKIAPTSAHAVSVQNAWREERFTVVPGRKYRLAVTGIGGTATTTNSIKLLGSEAGSTTASVDFSTNTNGVLIGPHYSDEFVATSDNCACLTVYIASGQTFTDVKLKIALLDSESLDQYVNNATEIASISTLLSAHAPAWQNPVYGLYGNYPTIKKDGTNIIVNIPSGAGGRIVYNNGYKSDAVTTARSYTLENGNYLLYNTTSKELRVETSSGNFTADDIIVLFNTNGAVYGQWAVYAYRNLIEPQTDIPVYYHNDNYIENKVNAINTIAMGLGRQAVRNVFFTDYHIQSNARNSPEIIRYLIKKTGITNVVFGGDTYNKDTTSKLNAYNNICEFLSDFEKVKEVSNLYYISGNHEYNTPKDTDSETLRLSQDAVYLLFNDPNHYKINCFQYSNSFYFDDNSTKIRTYCIDCAYDSTVLPSADARWEIFDSMLDVPDGYAVLIYSHAGQTEDSSHIISGINGRFGNVMQCAAMMDQGISDSITIGNTSRTYDFTGKQHTFIGAITGHLHTDGYYMYTLNGIKYPVITTMCDANSQNATPSHYQERQSGTITEQAFDVVQIDVDTRRIYMNRIGYGSDRVFSFGTADAGLIT